MKAEYTTKILSNRMNREKLEDVLPLDAPFGLEVGLSGVCNLKCKFCFQNNPAISKKYAQLGMMDEVTFHKAVDDALDFPQKLKNFKIVGIGEELANPQATDYIEYACKKDVADLVEITTNGTLLTYDMIDRLTVSGLDRINISIEALTDDGYYEICSKKIDVGEMVNKISYMYQRKEKAQSNLTIYVKIADVSLKDETDKDLFFEMFGDICDEIYIENIIPAWAANDDTSTNWIRSRKKGKTGIGEFGQEAHYKKACPFPFTKMYIFPNGDVSFCNVFSTIGLAHFNINERSLIDIWNSKEFFEFFVAQLTFNRESYSCCANCNMNKYIAIDDIDGYAETILERVIERGKKYGHIIG